MGRAGLALALALCLVLGGCTRQKPDPNTAVLLYRKLSAQPRSENRNDAQSERIDELIFEGLVRRDNHFELKPRLAESWKIPNPLTYIFHLRHGVRFHDGRAMTSADVKWTLDSLLSRISHQSRF